MDTKVINAANLPVENPNHIDSVYSNNAYTMFTPWDIRLLFTEIVPLTNGTASAIMRGSIVMNPGHAKAFLATLEQSVKLFEAQFGEIKSMQPQQAETPKT